ncbi:MULTISPECIES: integrating conjugative element protein [Pseudomonas]|uniref:integrating conjugative element protein n=1 Tax=Pseudomonas TaxID=286 RepID=UPI00093AFFDC|nr:MULTISPECIES: integrating conjugative element protein [Pseudomonas]MDH0639269.1 integrating conjugative element protein [Pseudomonas sp. GD03860]HBM67065.1 integrating conjugative element protein [Pseudomonas sp.]
MKILATLALCLSLPGLSVTAQAEALIVVEDQGGASALPYYEALNLQPRSDMASPRIEIPRPPARAFDESAMLPVRSLRLSPGEVARRVIEAPGLPPLFLVGDDERSRTWLRQRAPRLRELNAVGLVVNVFSAEALATLRTLVPGLSLDPVAGDDLAERLGLRHYPVLITATGIEQ